MARRAGSVMPSRAEWPRLLATAEDTLPEAWDREVELWPDVARATLRLPSSAPSSTEASGILPAVEPKFLFDFCLHSPLGSVLDVSDFSSFDVSASLSTPSSRKAESTGFRRARVIPRIGDLDPPDVLELPTSPSTRSVVPDDVEGEIEPSQFDVGRELSLSGSLNNSMTIGSSVEEPSTRSPRRRPGKTIAPLPEKEQVLDRLSYVHACRGLLGESRYGVERRRLELSAYVIGGPKYVAAGTLNTDRPQSRFGENSSTSRQVAQMSSTGRKAEATVKHFNLQEVRAAGNEQPRTLGKMPTASEVQVPVGVSSFVPASKLGSKAGRAGNTAFQFGSLCKQNKITPPHLGTFTIDALELALEKDHAKAQHEQHQLLEHELDQEQDPDQERGDEEAGVESPRAPPPEQAETGAPNAPRLTVGNWSLGDGPLLMLAGSELGCALEACEHHLLRGNRITDDGMCALATRLGARVEQLDLAANAYRARGVEALVRFFHKHRAPRLKFLNVSNNHLSDASVADLAMALLFGAPVLEELGLSDVNLGAGMRCGEQIGKLLKDAEHLVSLDMSYNMLQDDGAYGVIQGLYANGCREGRLRRLNLAWNCLGRGKTHSHVLRMLGSVLHDCTSLFHLDISFNQIGPEDCQLLANGLHENNSLWGIHVDGNAAIVDADGFLRVMPDMVMSPDMQCVTAVPPKALQKLANDGTRGKKRKAAKAKKTARSNQAEAQDPLVALETRWRIRKRATDAHAEHMGVSAETRLSTGEKKGHVSLPPELANFPASQPLPPRAQDEWLRTISRTVSSESRTVYAGATRCCSIRAATLETASASAPEMPSDVSHSIGDDVKGRSCWVCGGWVEVPFVLTPGASVEQAAFGPKSLVCAFVSVDNFSRPVLLQPEGNGRCWKGSRFLPPASIPFFVVFQVDGSFHVSEDMQQGELLNPLRLRLLDPPTKGSSATHCAVSVPRFEDVKKVNLIYVADRFRTKLDRGLADPEQQTIRDVTEKLVRGTVRPRLLSNLKGNGSLYYKERLWTPARSIWADHKELEENDFEADIMKCLKNEWPLALQKFSKTWSSSELDIAHKALQDNFLHLWAFYLQVSTAGRQEKTSFGVTMGTFTKMLTDSGITSAHPNVSMEKYDCMFFTSKRVPNNLVKQVEILCPDGLVRWQFIEAVVRIGEACRGANECTGDAVKRIITQHIAPLGRAFWEELRIFRKLVFTEVIDDIVKAALLPLRKAFEFFADSRNNALRGRQAARFARRDDEDVHMMSPQEWVSYLSELGVFDEAFSEKCAISAYAVGAHVNPHEAKTGKHLNIGLGEFLLALAWVFYVRAGHQDGADRFPDVMERGVQVMNRALYQKLQEWQGVISQLRGSGGPEARVAHFRLSMDWLNSMWALVQHIFDAADDNRDGELSLRELRFAFAGQDIMTRLSALGLELEHVSHFFALADIDGSGSLTPVEALHGFARVKERMKRDEQALQLLREAFDRTGEADQFVTKEMFMEASQDSKLVAKMQLMQLDFTLADFWQFVEQEAEEKAKAGDDAVVCNSGQVKVTLDMILCIYLKYRDADYTGQKLTVYLRNLFERADVDKNGSLSADEFMTALSDPTTLDDLEKMGALKDMCSLGPVATLSPGSEASPQPPMSPSVEHKASRMPKVLSTLFSLIDQDRSGTLEINEVLKWFADIHEMSRHEELGERFTEWSKARK